MHKQRHSKKKPMPVAYRAERRIGEGVYGIVYAGVRSATSSPVAIKRNVSSPSAHGFAAIQEADALARLGAHPFIVAFSGAHSGKHIRFPDGIHEPCAGSKRPRDEEDEEEETFDADAVDDRAHFVMALERTNLCRATRHGRLPLRVAKIIFAQILLGLEWIHNRGLVHRDLKPGNVLFNASGRNPHIRICDYGLCGVSAGAPLTGPGLVTSWYRAPEVCLGIPYDSKIDVWALAMLMMEVVAGRAVLDGSEDTSKSILATILNRLPALTTTAEFDDAAAGLSAADRQGVRARLTAPTVAAMSNTLSTGQRHAFLSANVRHLAATSKTVIGDFETDAASTGTFDEFCDLIARMLSFHPEDRISVAGALEHPFFSWLSPWVARVRERFPPVPPPLPAVNIFHTETRALAYKLFVNIYKNGNSISWYDSLLLIHGLDLFDRHIEHQILFEHARKDAPAAREEEVWMQVYTCLYVFHKFYIGLDTPLLWAEFVPECLGDAATAAASEAFEARLLSRVCQYAVFRDTLAEISMARHGRLTSRAARAAIVNLASLPVGADGIPEWTGGSIRALSRHFDDAEAAQCHAARGIASPRVACSPPRIPRAPAAPIPDSGADHGGAATDAPEPPGCDVAVV